MRDLKNSNTRILYHMNYYDGPISGVCLYEGKKYYFDTIDEVVEEWTMNDIQWFKHCTENLKHGLEINKEDRIQSNWYRIFAIFETPEESMEIIEEDHKLFQKYVGNHCNYDEFGCRNGTVKENTEWSKYYKAKKKDPKIDVKNWKIILKFVEPF